MNPATNRVFIHIGVPKTGTTYLQGVLAANRGIVRKLGVLYPGPGQAHFLAAQDLTEHLFMGRENPRVSGSWTRLVKQARGWRGTVVLSHELLTMASPAHVQRAVSDLAPAEVHVIATVRDFERQLPAVWQERLKNGGKVSFQRHFQQAQEHSGAGSDELEGFWKQQDVTTILHRWAATIPAHRIHVITVPPKGAPRDLLWRRFAGVIGIDPSAVDLSAMQVRSNTSLSAPQARFLRRVNASLQDSVPRPVYISVVKRYLTQTLTSAEKIQGHFGLTPQQRAVAQRWSAELAAAVTQAGYDVVGDLQELRPTTSGPAETVGLDDVPASAEAGVAVDATASLLAWLASDRRPQLSTEPLGVALAKRSERLDSWAGAVRRRLHSRR